MPSSLLRHKKHFFLCLLPCCGMFLMPRAGPSCVCCPVGFQGALPFPPPHGAVMHILNVLFTDRLRRSPQGQPCLTAPASGGLLASYCPAHDDKVARRLPLDGGTLHLAKGGHCFFASHVLCFPREYFEHCPFQRRRKKE